MNQQIHLKSLVCGAFLGALLTFSIAAATRDGEPVWEYRVVDGRVPGKSFEEEINRQVHDGWEFVSASHEVDRWAFAVLKRVKK
jgi:hypothetical protein